MVIVVLPLSRLLDVAASDNQELQTDPRNMTLQDKGRTRPLMATRRPPLRRIRGRNRTNLPIPAPETRNIDTVPNPSSRSRSLPCFRTAPGRCRHPRTPHQGRTRETPTMRSTRRVSEERSALAEKLRIAPDVSRDSLI